MKKVWTLGSSNVDTTYRVENIPLKGYTVTAQSCKTATGGKGANQAFAAAYWGADVSFIGAVGCDALGEMLLDSLKKNGIHTKYVSSVEAQSGNAVIYVDNQGDNCIVVYPGANNCVPVNMDIPFNQDDIMVAQLEINIDAVNGYFDLAKQKGMLTVLNPSPYKHIPAEILKNTDIIVANENEASELGGLLVKDKDTAHKCAKEIMKYGPHAVVITLGSKGVFIKSGNEAEAIGGYKVKAVDTQGAGDAFLGSFIYGIGNGYSNIHAVEFANAVGALAVTKNGSTQLSMPKIEDVEEMFKGDNCE